MPNQNSASGKRPVKQAADHAVCRLENWAAAVMARSCLMKRSWNDWGLDGVDVRRSLSLLTALRARAAGTALEALKLEGLSAQIDGLVASTSLREAQLADELAHDMKVWQPYEVIKQSLPQAKMKGGRAKMPVAIHRVPGRKLALRRCHLLHRNKTAATQAAAASSTDGASSASAAASAPVRSAPNTTLGPAAPTVSADMNASTPVDGRPKPTTQAVRKWMRDRVAAWPNDNLAPTERDDWHAARRHFANGLTRAEFRLVRSEETPQAWRKQGKRLLWGVGKVTSR